METDDAYYNITFSTHALKRVSIESGTCTGQKAPGSICTATSSRLTPAVERGGVERKKKAGRGKFLVGTAVEVSDREGKQKVIHRQELGSTSVEPDGGSGNTSPSATHAHHNTPRELADHEK